jgi:mannose-1-phosphate guanylyltransferase
MKAVIFAGGVGTRLWPISRKKSPKQFEKIIGDKSTLQLTVERLFPEFKPEDIYISTGAQYVKLISQQLSMIPKGNIIGEPAKKDVGPAVALAMSYLVKKQKNNEPVIILWSDHFVKKEARFKKIIKTARDIVKREQNKIVFIGQKARFASQNLGWIEFGEKARHINGVNIHSFSNLKYRPDKKLAEKYFRDGNHCWNLGYFVTTPAHMLSLFKKFTPQIHNLIEKITKNLNGSSFATQVTKYYELMPQINFDNAILEQLDKTEAYVIVEDIGWSDVGAWEALKEHLGKKSTDNIIKGNVLLEDAFDNLVYNYEDKKMIVGVDLEELLVVNTQDVLLVAKKTSVAKIKKLVESFQGTENERLT